MRRPGIQYQTFWTAPSPCPPPLGIGVRRRLTAFSPPSLLLPLLPWRLGEGRGRRHKPGNSWKWNSGEYAKSNAFFVMFSFLFFFCFCFFDFLLFRVALCIRFCHISPPLQCIYTHVAHWSRGQHTSKIMGLIGGMGLGFDSRSLQRVWAVVLNISGPLTAWSLADGVLIGRHKPVCREGYP